MAYYSRKGGNTFGGRWYRRRRSSSYSRGGGYSVKRSWKKGKKSRSGSYGAMTSVTRKLNRKLEKLEKESEYGKSMKCSFRAPEPAVLRGGGGASAKHYFVVPVAEVLREAAKGMPDGSVYVTGVTLELDIQHGAAMDFFAACVSLPAHQGGPSVGVDVVTNVFDLGAPELGTGHCMLLESNHLSVAGIANAVFVDNGRDKSLFTASLSRLANVISGTSTLNQKTRGKHKDVVRMQLNRTASGGVAGDFVKDTVRVYWEVNKLVNVLDVSGSPSGERHALVCGIRRQVDGTSSSSSSVKKEYLQEKVGELSAVCFDVHLRRRAQ